MADPFSVAITVALNAATMAMSAMNRMEGPRLSDLTVSTADYGTPLMNIEGTKRVECICFYAENIREEKDTQKGKSGKYEEYRYFGTWASLVADHELRSIPQVWLDRKLAYDGLSEGQTSYLGAKFGSLVRVYLGSETQDPDPRMVATVEAEEGEGMCPAYLGVSYLFFEDFPLDKFGNRYPQVSATGIRPSGAAQFPEDETDRNQRLLQVKFTPDRRRLVNLWSTDLDVIDLQSRTLAWTSNLAHEIETSGGFGMSPDGRYIYALQNGFTSSPDLWKISLYGTMTHLSSRIDSASWIAGGTAYVAGVLCVYNSSFFSNHSGYLGVDDDGFPSIITVVPGFRPTWFFEDEDGNCKCAGYKDGNNGIYLTDWPTTNGDTGTIFASGRTGIVRALDNRMGQWVFEQDNHLFVFDKDTTDLLSDVAVPSGSDSPGNAFAAFRSGDRSIWLGSGGSMSEFSLSSGALIRTVDPQDWRAVVSDEIFYDGANHALINTDVSHTKIRWYLLDRDVETGEQLGTICGRVFELAGGLPGEHDFTELDQEIEGYAWSQGPAKEIIGALLELHDSDIRPSGFELEGKKRGQPLGGEAISAEWMVPEDGEPLYEVEVAAETDLPRRVVATFADPLMEDQPNTAMAQRNASSVKTRREVPFDLTTLRAHPDNIQPLLERVLRRQWTGATKIKCRVTPIELALEPADVRNLYLDGERLRCSLRRQVIRANRVIDCYFEVEGETMVVDPDWEMDDANPINNLFPSPGGITLGRPPSEVLIPQVTLGAALDLPLFSDAQEQEAPFMYLAAGPEGEGYWPGAGVWVSDTNDEDSFAGGFDSFSSDQRAVVGVALDALPDALTSVIDEGTQLNIVLPAGDELTSITNDQMLNTQTLNMAVVGSEIIQFREAELIEGFRWQISGLVRGCRGTEWAVGTHEAGETFLLVSDAVKRHAMGASEIGDTDYYKFSTLGDDLDYRETLTVPFAANSHRPYSPAHVTLTRDPITDDWLIEWIRRTRIGGSTINGQDVPLGETAEVFRVKIMNGAEVLETYEVEDTWQKLYTRAEQIADWGSAQNALTVQVVQVAPDLDLEGFATEASVTIVSA